MLEALPVYVRVNDWLHSAGQPSAEALAGLGAEGVNTVVNLALPTSDNAVSGEAELVSQQGLRYVHIPVAFDAPQAHQFDLFKAVLDCCDKQNSAEKTVLVHCAYNMRVSAFIYVYNRVTGMRDAQALPLLLNIWQPNEVWQRFLDVQLARFKLI